MPKDALHNKLSTLNVPLSTMEQLRLSIIVPIYNVEQYVAECIHSLYRQDIPQEEYEVICVDDCSPDNSAAIVERLQSEFPTLRIIHNERNKKLGGARNTGLRNAQGRYILFVDSDDMLKQNCLKQLIDMLDAGQDDYIHFNYVALYPDGTMGKELQFAIESKQMTGPDMFFDKSMPWQQQISACRKIYRRDFMLQHDLFFVEDTMYEDNDFSMRVAAAATKCRHIDVSPYIYRQVPTSTTHSTVTVARVKYWQATWPHITALLDTIGKQDARFVELIHFYMQYDLWDVLNNLYQLPKDRRSEVKHNLTKKEWLRYIRFLPIKRRVEYLYKLIKA